MPRDVRRQADGSARRLLSSRPRKLFYGGFLLIGYIFLVYLSADYRDFLIFYAICFGFSLLPIFGILSGLWRTFALLAMALLVMSLTPAGLVQGDYRTLPADMDLTIEVSGEAIPGIEGPQRITTDRRGFRTGNRVIDYADAAPYRIFAVGASTTEQAYLDDGRTWTRLLEQRLNAAAGGPVEVINTGVAGLRLVHHLATQERVAELNPDLLVFLVGINDWNRQVTAHFDGDPRLRRPLGERLRARFRRSMAFAFHQLYVALPRESKLVVREAQFAPMTDRAHRPLVVRYLPEAVSDGFARGMAELAARCRAGTYRCMLLTQPNAYYLDAPETATRHFRLTPPREPYTLDLESLVHLAGLYNGFVRDLAAREGLLLCDLAPLVPKGTAAFYDDVHFNTSGAEIVSEALARCVSDQAAGLP